MLQPGAQPGWLDAGVLFERSPRTQVRPRGRRADGSTALEVSNRRRPPLELCSRDLRRRSTGCSGFSWRLGALPCDARRRPAVAIRHAPRAWQQHGSGSRSAARPVHRHRTHLWRMTAPSHMICCTRNSRPHRSRRGSSKAICGFARILCANVLLFVALHKRNEYADPSVKAQHPAIKL